ncbi:hypothetical protein SUGI_0195980 [Cryptomeria japonica]|nr:hypothetical protein SUGI_0195980 [Cryptomeria japonica]
MCSFTPLRRRSVTLLPTGSLCSLPATCPMEREKWQHTTWITFTLQLVAVREYCGESSSFVDEKLFNRGSQLCLEVLKTYKALTHLHCSASMMGWAVLVKMDQEHRYIHPYFLMW